MSATQTTPDVRLLRTPEAARVLGLAPSTISKLRSTGGGPKYLKLGRAVAYRDADLREWLDSHPTLRSTSDSAA